MADHFSVIGFKTSSAEELADIVSKLPEASAYTQPCGPGYYYRWQSEAGSELWVHLAKQIDGGDEQFNIVGVTPFFSGEGRVPVRVIKKRQRPADNAFEGAVFVEIAPGAKPHQCATVALLDLVDYAVWAGRTGPFLADAQIAAFPHQLSIFESEEEFNEAQQTEELKFSPEALFASGLFTHGGEMDGQTVFHDPQAEDFDAPAHAFITGRVLSFAERQNSVTGQSFYTTLIKTLGGTIDLVADDSQISEKLSPGAVIQGEFWLCAKLNETN